MADADRSATGATGASEASGSGRGAAGSGPGGAGAAGSGGTSPSSGGGARPDDPLRPTSILTCPTCARKNRIRPSETGTPHCGSCGAALPWVVSATDETFAAEARASVAVLVDLWAPWCGPCRFVSPILEELAREYAGRLKVVKVNVDENPRLAGTFDARSIPTLMVLRGGRPVDRIVGALPKGELTVRLTPHLLRR